MTNQIFNILPTYYDTVWQTEAEIYLLWGGRDRGASHFTAQQAIWDSQKKEEYYRAILVRKTFESIRDSQWQTIKAGFKDRADAVEWEHTHRDEYPRELWIEKITY